MRSIIITIGIFHILKNHEILVSVKCPKDQTELIIDSKEGVVGSCCNKCSSIFLNDKGTKAFRVNFDTDIFENLFVKNVYSDSPLNCPNCNHIMSITYINDIEIDICRHCQGVWFDKEEVRKIIDEYSPISERKKPSLFDSILDYILYFPMFIALIYIIYEIF